MVEADFLHRRRSLRIRELFRLELVMVTPRRHERFQRGSVSNPHRGPNWERLFVWNGIAHIPIITFRRVIGHLTGYRTSGPLGSSSNGQWNEPPLNSLGDQQHGSLQTFLAWGVPINACGFSTAYRKLHHNKRACPRPTEQKLRQCEVWTTAACGLWLRTAAASN